jgi:CrcB protein
MNIFLIGIGGGLGAISRYFFTEVTLKYIPLSYPIGTLGVNVIGCFLIGAFIGYSMPIKDSSYYFFVIGFLGSFTTMSAFTHQTMLMFNSNIIVASSYIIATVVLSIAATYFGTFISR